MGTMCKLRLSGSLVVSDSTWKKSKVGISYNSGLVQFTDAIVDHLSSRKLATWLGQRL